MEHKSNTKIKRTTLRISKNLVKEIELAALEDNRSFNQMVNILVEKGLSQVTSEVEHGKLN
ncbi:MAG: hypothetical protein EOM67_10120 [Spirochaetia bacterium]|nr:hypothetical protein [Spirochaetia bacterium]